VVVAAVAIACPVLMAGCSSGGSASCPSWASFPTPQERYEEAVMVVTTASATPGGTEEIFGVDAAAYDVVVDTIEKGKLPSSGKLRVISMPDPCGGEGLYSRGDPMATAGFLRLYLRDTDGLWATLTPDDGVEALAG
jgi:hypothetical protein